MTLSITFYNNIKYTKDDFIARDRDFYGNGVVKLSDFPLEVVGDGSGMQVEVGAGAVWVDGYRIENDAKIPLKLETGSAKARYDIIQIGHDDLNSRADVKVKKGIAGDTPIEPGADPGYVKLFAIRVASGVTKVAAADLLDRRELVPLKVSAAQISFDGVVASTKVGMPNGVASLGADGKVPPTQLPDLNYIPLTSRGAAGGVATLDTNKRVPVDQLPYAMDQNVKKTDNPTFAGLNATAQIKVTQTTNLAGLVLEGATTGFASGLMLNNTSTNGRKYSMYSDSTGLLKVSDETAGTTKFFVEPNGNFNLKGSLILDNAAERAVRMSGTDYDYGLYLNSQSLGFYDWKNARSILGYDKTSGAITITPELTVSNIKANGAIRQVYGVATQGNFGVSTVLKSVSEQVLTTNTATSILVLSSPPTGNYGVNLWLRTTAACTVTIAVSFTDNVGSTTQTLYSNQPLASGDRFAILPYFFYAKSTASITVTVTASVANALYVSATLEGK